MIDDVPTFSQTPCAPDAKELNIKINEPKSAASSHEELAQACLELSKKKLRWKDPFSLRVASYEHHWLSDASGARQALFVDIAGKNSYGGYDGSKPFICYLNHSGTQLSKVQQWLR
jgi:hypothetical protein